MTVTATATFCATIVDEWVRAGVTTAFVAPGSRSTPLALALEAEPRLAVQIFHDERGAAFAALGSGLASGLPAVALCTSGTAATHFHAAVVEADLSSVPLIVCTADRPPELWDIGAPQTIDQTKLFADSVRFYAEPGVPDEAVSASWRSLGSRVVAEAEGWAGRPGPVHLNLSFRDPLVGEVGEMPPGRADGSPWHDLLSAACSDPVSAVQLAAVVGRLHVAGTARSGLIVAGHGTDDPKAVLELSLRLGWPVLADHRSRCRAPGLAVTYFDSLIRSDRFRAAHSPEVVLRFGEALSSKVLGQWLSSSSAEVISVVDRGRWSDPERTAGLVVAASGVARGVSEALPTDLQPAPDREKWQAADRVAAEAIAAILDQGARDQAPSEIEIARHVVAAAPTGGALVLSSSMPVRDVEWYGPNRDDLSVLANRGANGIDGVIATAIGVASTGRPTTVLIGDVALLHDATSLIALADRPIRLDIVVIDNDGGGIFSFLPQADQLAETTFERLFGTPHGTDLGALARAHGIQVVPWPLEPAAEQVGPRVTIVRTDRRANVVVHREVNDAVERAVGLALDRSTGQEEATALDAGA